MEAGKAIVIISIFVVYSVYGQKLTTEYVFYQPPSVRASNSACRCGLKATNPDGKQHSMHMYAVQYGMAGKLCTVWYGGRIMVAEAHRLVTEAHRLVRCGIHGESNQRRSVSSDDLVLVWRNQHLPGMD